MEPRPHEPGEKKGRGDAVYVALCGAVWRCVALCRAVWRCVVLCGVILTLHHLSLRHLSLHHLSLHLPQTNPFGNQLGPQGSAYTGANTCTRVRFSYHMHGTGMGALYLEVRNASDVPLGGSEAAMSRRGGAKPKDKLTAPPTLLFAGLQQVLNGTKRFTL